MISAIVLTKNEEKNIGECLDTLLWCDEIIVVDDNSIDKTIAIAKKGKAKAFFHSLNGDFSKQRNFALEKAKGEWVLFVDADERVTTSLRNEIKSEIKNQKSQIAGYKIKRIDFMWRRQLKHGEVGDIKLVRLAKKDAGKWQGNVHEIWRVKGKTGELKNPLLHYPHLTIAEFLQDINFYTDIRVKELYQKGINVYWWSVILYPKVKFFVNFFIRLGFLDGIPGLLHAIIMSFHSFVVRGKLWLLWQKSK